MRGYNISFVRGRFGMASDLCVIESWLFVTACEDAQAVTKWLDELSTYSGRNG